MHCGVKLSPFPFISRSPDFQSSSKFVIKIVIVTEENAAVIILDKKSGRSDDVDLSLFSAVCS